ncbi:MAG: TetR family transcriptional regulator [Microbacterium sp.]|mgnify:CR=1|nr:TetR family transcriptional regulator [Microbacterium sp.]
MAQRTTRQRTRLTPDERRRGILEAALTVFGRDGYRDGSLQDVAAEAGLTVQGLLHYFPTKVDLLIATLDRWQTQATDDFSDLAEGDLREIGRAILARNLSHPGVMRLRIVITAEATSESHPAYDRMVERYADIQRVWTERVAEQIAEGRYSPDLDAEATAAAMISLLDGLQLQYLLRPEMDLLAAYDAATQSMFPAP